MQSFEIEVFPRQDSWLIRVGDRVMSGAATRPSAERIARLAADSLRRAGYEVSLSVQACPGAAAFQEVLPATLRSAA